MEINYKQLTFAREYRGISQTELASNITGLSQSNLSKFEKGLGTLSNDVLSKIIDFLGFPESFYKVKISNKVENAHFRRKSGMTKKERSQIEYSNKLIGYIIDQMAESIVFPDLSIRLIDLEDSYSPEYAAQYTRKYLGLKDEPVRDVFSLLERNGVIIVEFDYNVDLFDGVSFVTDEGYSIIIINKNFSNDHKRFTLAHELGHLIMHSSGDFLIPDYRDKEQEANRFASEFLMPAEIISKSLRGFKLSYSVELKRYWLTSMASIIRRAKDLRCISQSQYQYFNIELSRKGYKKKEPVNVYIDNPKIFSESIRLHEEELDYTKEEMASAFHIPIDVLKRFCYPSSSHLKLKLSI
ncbi:ImmA/IrrE family metallo-endopeptidase [Paludibacter sp. 221]|uniref:helix-turn-helix domain-containing protein n=1 Tax=Paludibacter sp. 221 TaxID=2302939 RepID=UPI0013D1E263|nr:XRE family transcriptional regulator [Paludibacter sp. 221]NDV47454.1 ImmA/IrrE family metallo-endopeptidase [Paludibacter sp. 221]